MRDKTDRLLKASSKMSLSSQPRILKTKGLGGRDHSLNFQSVFSLLSLGLAQPDTSLVFPVLLGLIQGTQKKMLNAQIYPRPSQA